MRAHGIPGPGRNRPASSQAPPSPDKPLNANGRKPLPNKKRRIADITDDVDDDDDDVKPEVKNEKIKHEADDQELSGDSCMTTLNNSPLDTAASTLVVMSDGVSVGNNGADDDVYLICTTEKKKDFTDRPAECSHQDYVPMEQVPTCDHAHVHHCSQPALANAGVTPYPSVANTPSQPMLNRNTHTFTGGAWYYSQDPALFWNDRARTDIHKVVDRT